MIPCIETTVRDFCLGAAVEARGTFKTQSNFERYGLNLIHSNGDNSHMVASAIL
jgi:hypothetical protein